MMVATLKTPAGLLIARPWFDRLALKVLATWFFPSSRLWAAASVAGGSVDRFFDAVPVRPERRLAERLSSRLQRFERARGAVTDCTMRWEEAFFGAGESDRADLANVEQSRLSASNNYNLQRRLFMSLGLNGRIRPIRWDVPSPESVAEIYGAAAADPARAFAAPEVMPEVTVSRCMAAAGSRDYWLRFDSPAPRMNDRVIARVHEPEGVSDPPTLIFGHGICVENDHWRGMVDDVADLVSMGVRVVRPEAPWHGHRAPAGEYGGERFMATAPLGALDLFTSAALEWAVLLDWCRSATRGPVCIGGSSLGAMTAQLIATNAHLWPERLRPDAMLLVTHCGHIADAVVSGSLAKVWGIEDATVAGGWTPDLISRYLPLIDPVNPPAVARENIVTVLGACDDVTPFNSARILIDDWGLPDENVFVSRRGHFSVPLAMMRDHAPLHRFVDILKRMT